MPKNLAIRQLLDCSEPEFWDRIFRCEKFNQYLYERLGFEYEIEEWNPQTGYRRAPSCEPCLMTDRCPGLPAALAGTATPIPIKADPTRRRLSNISTVAQQIERELVTEELYRNKDGSSHPASTIRLAFHCNQACEFCFVSTHLPPPPATSVTPSRIRLIEMISVSM